MISFGHGMFFGLGAYGFGLLMQRTGVSIPIAFVSTLLITAIVATVIGAICVRLKEIYFAFVTLAFQMLIHSTILSWSSLTGGDQGLRGGIPRPAFLGIDLTNHVHLYITACALLVIGLLLMRQIVQSPFGYTLRMIRDNATRANFIGIDVWRAKLTIFVLAAVFASMGGIIMALFTSGAYPEFAYWTISGEGIFINMLGGVTTFLGPIVGTVLLLTLNDQVTRLTEHYGAPLRDRIAGRLSGGEQQMLAIARTLMGNPALLLLDEPSEGLAPIIVQRIGELLRQLRGTGATVLIAEQNMHFCLGLASHATVIDKGQIVYTATIDDLRANADIRQRYLAL